MKTLIKLSNINAPEASIGVLFDSEAEAQMAYEFIKSLAVTDSTEISLHIDGKLIQQDIIHPNT